MWDQESPGQGTSWECSTPPAGSSAGLSGAQRGPRVCPGSLSIIGAKLTIHLPTSVTQMCPHSSPGSQAVLQVSAAFQIKSASERDIKYLLFFLSPEANWTSPKGLGQVILPQISKSLWEKKHLSRTFDSAESGWGFQTMEKTASFPQRSCSRGLGPTGVRREDRACGL